jgi:hypothetical protein
MSEFKKKFQIKDKQILNKSERKKFINLISTKLSLNEEMIEKLFPAKTKINRIKLMGSNTLIYTNESNEPLFYDDHSKSDIFPTLYALKIFPNMLPTLRCPKAVLEFLRKGLK